MRSNVIRRIAATATVCLKSPDDLRFYYIEDAKMIKLWYRVLRRKKKSHVTVGPKLLEFISWEQLLQKIHVNSVLKHVDVSYDNVKNICF